MKLWDLYCFNIWVDVRRMGRKFKRLWKTVKQNYYGRIIKNTEVRFKKFEERRSKLHDKFYACGGDYISAKVNGGFHERPDIEIKSGAVRL